MSSRADEHITREEDLAEVRDCRSVAHARIDWASLDAVDVDRSDMPADTSDLQPETAPLDPARERVQVATLYPDRLEPADSEDGEAITRAQAQDLDPASWVGYVNPRFREDLERGEPGHTTNCADAARAFQEGLEGKPRAAARIAPGGLPAADDPEGGGGEASIYTEQWAGERFEPAAYDAIESRIRTTRGSAIVHATGPYGGHAFNVYFDRATDEVRYADAQRGAISEFRDRYEARFPHARAIYFERSEG